MSSEGNIILATVLLSTPFVLIVGGVEAVEFVKSEYVCSDDEVVYRLHCVDASNVSDAVVAEIGSADKMAADRIASRTAYDDFQIFRLAKHSPRYNCWEEGAKYCEVTPP